MPCENDWTNLVNQNYATEGDVENRLISPLLQLLGWKLEEIHSKVPVKITIGRKKTSGRYPEADFALAPQSDSSPATAWVVVEAKNPEENITNGADQAWSYSLGLRAAYYLVTNGEKLEVWQTQYFGQQDLLLALRKQDLATADGRKPLLDLLNPQSVKDYCEHVRLKPLDSNSHDIGPYINFLYSSLDPMVARQAITCSRNTITLGVTPIDEIVPNKARVMFITGKTGRGKSSVIQILVAQSLLTTRSRIPISISLKQNGALHLRHLLAKKLSVQVPALASEGPFLNWLEKTPILICIDDWDRVTDDTRSRLTDEISEISAGHDVIVVVAGLESVAPPNIKGIRILRLEELTDQEIEKFIAHYTGNGTESPPKLRDISEYIPAGLKPALREPIFLSKYLEQAQNTPHIKRKGPNNLAELMHSWLESTIRPLTDRVSQSLDTVVPVCKVIASKNSEFALGDVKSALQECGCDSDPSHFIDKMISTRIVDRIEPGTFSFSHDCWKEYFCCLTFVDAHKNDKAEQLLECLRTIEASKLQIDIPLLVGLIKSSECQENFLAALMAYDAELYLDALKWRPHFLPPRGATSFQAEAYLQSLHSGYVGFIERWLPNLKFAFMPWSGASEEDDALGHIPAVVAVGGIEDYAWGFASKSEGSVVLLSDNDCHSRLDYMPRHRIEEHWVDLELSGLPKDNGRILGCRECLKGIEKWLDPENLPSIGWIGRERIRKFVSDAFLRYADNSDWSDWSVSEVIEWIVDKETQGLSVNGPMILPTVIGSRRTHTSLQEIHSILADLHNLGLGEMKIVDLGLPPPDRTCAKTHESLAYSDDQKINWFKALFQAVAITYDHFCQTYFKPLSQYFKYAGMPCKAVIELTSYNGKLTEGCKFWWEPTKDDFEPEIRVQRVDASESYKQNSKTQLMAEFDRIRYKFRTFGRPNPSITLHRNWLKPSPWSGEITDLVSSMLKADVARLRKIGGL